MREAKVAFMAPGQGITSWEDGLRLLEESERTSKIYEVIHDATDVDIPEVCRRDEPINDPAVVLPAALGIGVARSELLQHDRNIKPDYLISVSSGEITVSVISGAIALREGAELAQKRGLYQQEASGGKGGVITVFHREPIDWKSLLRSFGDKAYPSSFHVKNGNGINITGISYRHEVAAELKKTIMEVGAKAKDVQNLDFIPHGGDVREAQERLARLFKSRKNGGGIVVRDAVVPMIATRTAKAMRKARTIKNNIIWQTSQPTQLSDGVNFAVNNGVEEFYDLGPGDSMFKLIGYIVAGMNIKIVPSAT